MAEKFCGYEDGGRYFCWYWKQNHSVSIKATPSGYKYIESRWDDGRVTCHCTGMDKRDFRVN